MPVAEKPIIDSQRISLALQSIKLDSNGNLPTRFMLMQTGDWADSVKGDFKIKLENLKNIKANFDAKVGFPTEDASTGLAVDFMHNYAAEAAAWIKGLELQADEETGEGKLFANPVEWTDAGAKAVLSGEFKCISPSGYFGERNGKVSMWSNPNNLKEKIQDVLDGAGLTNIPFLRGMSPIRASRDGQKLDDTASAYDNLIYVVDNQHKKEQSMNLDSLRTKERNDLSVPELDFLAENKEKLSADELNKFQLGAEANKNEEEQLSDDDKNLLAAIKSGDKVVTNKEELSAEQKKVAALEKTALDYRTDKAHEVVDGHIARGAIKSDSRDFWTEELLSADETRTEQLKTQLAALPSNELLSDKNKKIGTDEDTAAGSTAREQFDTLAKAKVQEAAKDGKTLLYGDALKEVIRENKDLASQDVKEQLSSAAGRSN